jgi:hypothetical protein
MPIDDMMICKQKKDKSEQHVVETSKLRRNSELTQRSDRWDLSLGRRGSPREREESHMMSITLLFLAFSSRTGGIEKLSKHTRDHGRLPTR